MEAYAKAKPAANYPRNCWWVAATTAEVGRTPLGRWLLDDPVVLYRLADRTAVALENRCVHRWAPLSQGAVIGDQLVCRYHGARFEADGTCSRVPSQKTVPPGARVRAYPIQEQDGFVWIWMGDPTRAQSLPPPRLEFNNGGQWWSIGGYMPVEANYFLLQENVLDLTHFGFLHADTLGQEGWEEGLSDIEVKDGTVTYRKTVAPAAIAPFINLALGAPEGMVMPRTDWGTFVSPSTHIAGIDFDDPLAPATKRHFRIAHLTTPISMQSAHYWWVEGQNYGTGSAEQRSGLLDGLKDTFQQDKDMLEAIQQTVRIDPRHANAPEVSFLADRPGLHARKIVRDMLSNEGNSAIR